MATCSFTKFHEQQSGQHIYPNEYLVRTMLGRYPRLRMDRDYVGRKVLDLGCGDGRNMPLFHNCGLEIFGVEVDKEGCELVRRRMAGLGVPCTAAVGHNSSLPFGDGFFDYVVASNSIYYIMPGERFSQNLAEAARVLRPGGHLVATLLAPGNFLLLGAESLGGGHFRVTADPFGLRNGTVVRMFADEGDIRATFSPHFDDLGVGSATEDYYGLVIKAWYLCGRRRQDGDPSRRGALP